MNAGWFLENAVRFLAAGEFNEALRAASDACRDTPHLPQPHYAYGQAWAALGEHAKAERAFAAALQLEPGWPDAWVNYGVARYRQGAIDDAKIAMREALRRAPDHAAARANLGAFLRLTGEGEAAEALLRESLAREPGNVGARLNLAADLLREERAVEALDVLSKAPSMSDPRAARHWLLQQSLALLQLGRIAQARVALEAFERLGPIPPNLAPLWHWRQVLLALSQNDIAKACDAAEAVETSLATMGGDAVLEHQIMAHYDLAKFWSGHAEHDRAFAHWTRGHALLAPSQPFSRGAHLASIEANIAHFDRSRFASGPRAQNSDPAPVFIVGMPRSGTTLCEQIIAAHADAHGGGERAALGRMVDALGGDDAVEAVRRIAALDTDRLDTAASANLAELHALAPGKTRIVDKMPGNYIHLGLVGLMLPRAKIIHCTRDPRDIGLSIFTFRFHGVHAYAHDLGDLGWTIRQQHRLMDHWKQALPSMVLTVALADWIEDFDGTLARLLAHLELRPDPNCARFYESEIPVRTVSRAQVRQPINANGIGRWRLYASALAPLLAELEPAADAVDPGKGTP